MTETVPKMRKLNSSIDIIPLQGASNEANDSPRIIGKRKFDDKNENRQHNHMHRDPLIISRVQDYLYANEDKVYIDVTEMADSLMKKHRDYRNKKRGPFRIMVRRAYDEITESFSKKSDNQSKPDDEDEEDDDEEDEVEIQSDGEVTGTDTMSNELLKMYKKKIDEQNGNSSDKELIDISSDDDAAEIEDIATEKIPQTQISSPIITKQTKKMPHSCSVGKSFMQSSHNTNNDNSNFETKKYDNSKQKVDMEKGRKRLREKSNELTVPASIKKRKEGTFGTKVQEKRFKFSDIGGNTQVLETVSRLLVHMKHPEIFKQLGIAPPRGFLLHGPPGCGKSLMAHAIAGELDIPFLKIAAPELIAGVSGESESRIRELFEQALSLAPCVLFLDEIDTLAPHRANAQKEMERRIVAQLLSCLDELGFKENGDKVLVLGATNRPDAIDPALRRAGRFDREISLGIPDKDCRAKILQVHSSSLKLADDVDHMKIAALSPGFVGADLVSLLREAAIAAIDRVFRALKTEEKAESNKSDENKEDKVEKEKTTDIEMISEDKEAKSTTDEIEKVAETVVEKVAETVAETEPVVDSVMKEADTELPQSSTNDSVILESIEPKELKNPTELERLLEMLHNKVAIPPERLADLRIENVDFETAFKVVQPSSKREGFATVPDVTWDDIGSLQEIREELKMAILAPVKHSEDFAAFGLTTPTGVLLCGPPGCGKTLLAKAVANEAEINFISVKGPELLNMYVGESEKAVRQCFIRARNSAPCVIFFDELDALCPKRTDGDNSSTSRVVNQVLTEMDGVEGRKGVYLMAATNRPDIIDPAVMRPGRFDKILYVGLPTPLDRVDILKALTKNGTKPKFAKDADLEIIGKSLRCDGYTGADLAGLIRESGIAALKESMENSSGLTEVHMRHVEIAFNKVRPSVQEKDARHYEKLRKQYTVQNVIVADTPVTESSIEAMET